MPLETHTCVTATCDRCGEHTGDDFVPHFATAEEAVAELRRDGGLVTDTVMLCPGCALRADCEATGHQHVEWEHGCVNGIEFRRSNCEHCGALAYDPSREQLADLWRIARMVDATDNPTNPEGEPF